MKYRNMTFNIEESILYDLKRLALDERCSQKKLVNEILKEGIKQRRGQLSLDEL